MKQALPYIQIVISILLIAAILLQGRGAGLSNIFGGASAIHQTKRGMDKFLHYTSIVLGVLFLGFAVLNLVLK
jgi:protein translocase SecG subunit